MVSTEDIGVSGYPKVADVSGAVLVISQGSPKRSCCSKKALRAACAQDSSLPSLCVVALVEEATVGAMR